MRTAGALGVGLLLIPFAIATTVARAAAPQVSPELQTAGSWAAPNADLAGTRAASADAPRARDVAGNLLVVPAGAEPSSIATPTPVVGGDALGPAPNRSEHS